MRFLFGGKVVESVRDGAKNLPREERDSPDRGRAGGKKGRGCVIGRPVEEKN